MVSGEHISYEEIYMGGIREAHQIESYSLFSPLTRGDVDIVVHYAQHSIVTMTHTHTKSQPES